MNAEADGSFHAFPQRCGQVFALGLTYADHIRETAQSVGEPVVFMKCCQPEVEPNVLPTPDAAGLLERISRLDDRLARWLSARYAELPALLDYEVELGLLMLEDFSACDLEQGRLPAVGFFLANDLTARSVQIAGHGAAAPLDYWSAAKSLPGFLPVSSRYWRPTGGLGTRWPVLTLKTLVNGELRQSASTSDLMYSPPEVLRSAMKVSTHQRLHRHDLILTGTPAGVALFVPRWKQLMGALLPRRMAIAMAITGNVGNSRFLRSGDQVEVLADWLGHFSTSIR